MTQDFDQSGDLNGQATFRLLSLYGAPPYVKQASLSDFRGTDRDAKPHDYAWPTRQRYYCGNPAATWLSCAFFFEKQADLSPAERDNVQRRLDQAVEYFQIRKDVETLQTKMAQARETDPHNLPDDLFALVVDTPQGKQRFGLMRNAREVKAAADYLVQHRDRFPYVWRQEFADNVLVKAAEYGAGLGESYGIMERIAGRGICGANQAVSLINRRIKAAGGDVNHDEDVESLRKIAEDIQAAPMDLLHYETLTKLAEGLDGFDRKHNLTSQYGDILQRPEDVLFAVTLKSAAEALDTVAGNDATGMFYQKDALATLPVSRIAETLGQDFADRVSSKGRLDMTKLAQALPRLSRSNAQAFDAVAAEAGVRPFAMQSTAPVKLNTHELAARHRPGSRSLWDYDS